MNTLDYWKECVESAAEECGAVLTQEQIAHIAYAVEGGHENYGMAYPNPPSTDRIAVIERECSAKVKLAQAEADRIRADFVANVCIRRNCSPAEVTLEGGGLVTIQRW